MAEEIKTGINLQAENIKKEIIPDNDYLPFIKLKEKLLGMEVGDIQVWPAKKANAVRVMSGRIQRRTEGIAYRYKLNRKDQTIEICRFS